MDIVRAAVVETINQYPHMPGSLAELPTLREKLDDIRAANVEHHVKLVAKAKGLGVQVICFGELFPAPYFALSHEPMWRAMAEPVDGATVHACQAAAREHEMVVVAPIYRYEPGTHKRFNSAVVIDADGDVLGVYDKTHIPHGENEAAAFLEQHYYEASEGPHNPHPQNVSQNRFFPVFQTKVGRIGVAICYDRHFEGVMSALAREGAELVFCPAVTFGKKSRRMWQLEFDVDAARHNLFIAGSNRRGREAPWNEYFYGGSHFVGPNGRVRHERPHPELVVADLPLVERSRADPAGWQLIAHRRPDIYG